MVIVFYWTESSRLIDTSLYHYTFQDYLKKKGVSELPTVFMRILIRAYAFVEFIKTSFFNTVVFLGLSGLPFTWNRFILGTHENVSIKRVHISLVGMFTFRYFIYLICLISSDFDFSRYIFFEIFACLSSVSSMKRFLFDFELNVCFIIGSLVLVFSASIILHHCTTEEKTFHKLTVSHDNLIIFNFLFQEWVNHKPLPKYLSTFY